MSSLSLAYVNLGTDDPLGLARFYAELLGWPRPEADVGSIFVTIDDPAGGTGVACQYEQHHARPSWPAAPGEQAMQLHLEIRVEGLDDALDHARECGATLAKYQPQEDVRVCLDPAGHPFCLYVE